MSRHIVLLVAALALTAPARGRRSPPPRARAGARAQAGSARARARAGAGTRDRERERQQELREREREQAQERAEREREQVQERREREREAAGALDTTVTFDARGTRERDLPRRRRDRHRHRPQRDRRARPHRARHRSGSRATASTRHARAGERPRLQRRPLRGDGAGGRAPRRPARGAARSPCAACTATIEAHAQSGDIEVRDAGDRLDVETLSGDVHVQGVRGDASIHTLSGDVTLNGAPRRRGGRDGERRHRPARASHREAGPDAQHERRPDVRRHDRRAADATSSTRTPASSASQLPANVGAQLSLSTFSGEIDSDFPITLIAGRPRHRRRAGQEAQLLARQGYRANHRRDLQRRRDPLLHRETEVTHAPSIGARPMPRRSRAALAAILLARRSRRARRRRTGRSERRLHAQRAVPAGQWLRVRNVNGEVRVRAVDERPRRDHRDEDLASRRSEGRSHREPQGARRQHPRLRLLDGERDLHGERLPLEQRRPARNRDNDVAVDFEVRVPKGVNVGAWSVNGEVSVDGATSEVRAGTVNGCVDATSTGGPVQASSVNGSVHARMGTLDRRRGPQLLHRERQRDRRVRRATSTPTSS